MSEFFDFGVVGGGILGLATAREILLRLPRAKVVLLEKERRLAQHQTGRNSGVIHSGIYYMPGSSKARNCVLGARLLQEYCEERSIPIARLGKLIIAASEGDLVGLTELERRAAANNITGVRRLSAAGIKDVEPHAVGLAALHVPGVGIVDYTKVAQTIASEIDSAGAVIRCSAHVRMVSPGSDATDVFSSAGDFSCSRVIVCAGLGGDRLALRAGGSDQLMIVPFRGDYYELRPGRQRLIHGLIYPVPDPRFPFLGIHFTPTLDGRVLLGPNAVLALALEGYRRRDIDLGHVASLASYPVFRTLANRYWRVGLAEFGRGVLASWFAAELRRYVPDVERADLLPGRSGIRAQAVTRDGHLLDDFWFERHKSTLLVRSAPSPAATASLAIAREIVDQSLGA